MSITYVMYVDSCTYTYIYIYIYFFVNEFAWLAELLRCFPTHGADRKRPVDKVRRGLCIDGFGLAPRLLLRWSTAGKAPAPRRVQSGHELTELGIAAEDETVAMG